MTQIKQKISYTVEGVDYDNYADAQKAMKELEAKELAAYNPERELASHTKVGNNMIKHHKEFPKYISQQGKHTTDIYLVKDAEDLKTVPLRVMSQFVGEGYYFDQDLVLAKAILDKKDGAAALSFLSERCSYEYEGFEVLDFD